MPLHGESGMPGFRDAIYSGETQVYTAGRDGETHIRETPFRLAAASVDAGNVPTTTLRGGTVMMERDSDKLVIPYDQAVAGRIVGVLPQPLSMLGPLGTAEDKWALLFVRGTLRHTELIGGNDAIYRLLAAIGFDYSASEVNTRVKGVSSPQELAAGSNVPLAVADHNGRRFIQSGGAASTANLPAAVVEGAYFEFEAQLGATITIADGGSGLFVRNGAQGANLAVTNGDVVRVEGKNLGGTLNWVAY